MAIIEIRNLSYAYPRSPFHVLRNINLSIDEGEFVAIMGPNGAGKSTLCMCINGLIPHVIGGKLEGDILVDGMNTKDCGVAELAKRVGTVLSDPESQLFGITVEEDVAFALSNLGLPKDEILRRVDEAVTKVRLSEYKHVSPYELSGGQQQRLAIAAALAMKPKILLLDEPTSNLDTLGTHEVMLTVRELNEKYGTTVVLVEHKSEIVAQYSDRVIVLNGGRVVLEGTPRDVFKRTDLLKAIGVEVPQVVELAVELKKRGLPVDDVFLSVNEAYEFLARALRGA